MTPNCDGNTVSSASSFALYIASTGFGAALTIIVGRLLERYKRRDRQRELAGALYGECERIRRALGKPTDELGIMGMNGLEFETPDIHRWIEHLVAEAAIIDVRLVELFVKLDTELHNYGVLVRRWLGDDPRNPFIEEDAVETRKDAVKLLQEIEPLLGTAQKPPSHRD